MKQTPLEKQIKDITTPVAEELGLEILYVQINGEGGAKTVQITAEDPETGRLGVDKCAQLSRESSTLLDVEDIISGAYRLEVSSPGIDRLLLRKKDFTKYAGSDIKLEANMPIETGQKRFRGILKGVNDEDIIEIETDEGTAHIEFDNVKKAKLVLTDELIKATAK